MSDETVGVDITADSSGAISATDLLGAAFKKLKAEGGESGKAITEQFKKVGESIEGVKEKIMALAAGGALAGIIREANEFAESAFKMSQMMGVSTEAASEQIVALKLVGMSADEYDGILMRMTTRMRNSEERMKQLGVVTRDASGHLLDGKTVMDNALKTLLSYKEGTDRNIVATELFGRNWASVIPLIRLDSEMKQRAKKDTEDLGLAMDKAGVGDALAFKVGLAEVGLVFEGLWKIIAEALLPYLTAMAEWFRGIAPPILHAFGVLLQSIINFLGGMARGFRALEVYVLGFISQIGAVANGVGRLWDAMSSDDKVANLKKAWSTTMADMAIQAEQTQTQINDIFAGIGDSGESAGKHGKEPDLGKGTKNAPGKAETISAMEKFRQELQKENEANSNLLEDQTKHDLAFWQTKLKVVKEGGKDWLAISAQIYALRKKLAQEGQEAEKQAEELELTNAKGDAAQKLAILTAWAEHQKAVYHEDSKEYRAAVRDKVAAEKELHDQQIAEQDAVIQASAKDQVANLNDYLKIAKLKQQAGQLSEQQLLQIEQDAAKSSYDIQREALQARIALLEKEGDDTRDLKQQLEKVDRDYNTKTVENALKAQMQIQKQWDSMLNSITSTFENTLKGLLTHTMTWQKAVQNVWNSVLGTFINLGMNMLKQWVAAEIAKTQATEVGVAARTSAEEAGSVVGLARMAADAIKFITTQAAKAFAGTFASASEMPGGFMLAPGLAAAADAEVLGMLGSVVGASGGFDIPSGVNPMVQTHQREMILPANLADKIRTMSDGGGGGDFHYHDNTGTLDNATIMRNGRKIAQAMGKQFRNFYQGK